MAPARRAAAATCMRVLEKMPVNVRWTPLSDSDRAVSAGAGRVFECVDHLIRALVALAALAQAAVHNFLQVIATLERSDIAGPHATAGIAEDQHAQQLPHLIHVVSRLPLRSRALEQVARRRHPVHRARGDAAGVALLPDDAEVAELEARPSQTNTLTGVRSRCSVWPRCSLPSTSSTPAISRRTTVSDHPRAPRFRNAPRSPCAATPGPDSSRRVRPANAAEMHRRRGSRARGRRAPARSTPRAPTRRSAR